MRRLLAAVLLLLTAWPAAAQKIERVVSPGGIEAWLVEERSIPMLTLDFALRDAGSSRDPDGREGLAELLAAMLSEGAGDLSSQDFKRATEALGIELGFGAGRDHFTGRLRTLTRHRERAFELMRLALTKPRLDAEPLERLRRQVLSGLARRDEDLRGTASRTWFETAFPGHPYARQGRGTEAGVKALGGDDLRAFLGQRLARDRLVVGVVGDIGKDELARQLDRIFGDLPATAAPLPPIADAVPQGAGIKVLRRPAPQAQVMFGLPGVKRDDPDYYAAYLMNYVLGGGGFVSRLYREVREKRGLAYSVFSYLSPMERAGVYLGGFGTENARVAEALGVVREQLERMRRDGLSEAELADAKTFVTGNFPLQLDSSSKISGTLVAIQLERLGIDFLARRNALFEAVTVDDIRRVAQRLLDPAKLLTVVVGQPVGVDG
ncbi:MAG: insulinase family protein [Alphaproteobacteria bacterium]|nr:insulinase family protein [Alphaproteobacteria bacterium]